MTGFGANKQSDHTDVYHNYVKQLQAEVESLEKAKKKGNNQRITMLIEMLKLKEATIVARQKEVQDMENKIRLDQEDRQRLTETLEKGDE